MTNGLSSTSFKSIVSVALSTVTNTERTVAACQALYAKVSIFEDIIALTDEKLIALIKPVAHDNNQQAI